jgi:hypothetical protein
MTQQYRYQPVPGGMANTMLECQALLLTTTCICGDGAIVRGSYLPTTVSLLLASCASVSRVVI